MTGQAIRSRSHSLRGLLAVAALALSLPFLAARAQGAIPAHIQTAEADNDAATTLSVTLDSVRPGSLLVVAIRTEGGDVTVSSPGATWTQDKQQEGLGWTLSVHSAPNVPGGQTRVTAQVAGTAKSVRMMVHEYSGVATSVPVHRTASNSSTSGSANSGSVTTTIDNCMLFCAVATDSDLLGFRAGSGFTLRGSAALAGDKVQCEDRGPVAAGTYSGAMSLNSDTWAAVLVAYKPSTTTTAVLPPANLHTVN